MASRTGSAPSMTCTSASLPQYLVWWLSVMLSQGDAVDALGCWTMQVVVLDELRLEMDKRILQMDKMMLKTDNLK